MPGVRWIDSGEGVMNALRGYPQVRALATGLMPARVREPLADVNDDDKAAIATALARFCEYNRDDGSGLAVAAIRVPR